ncbi:MAG: 16S rRNA (adenine(1518)-N(6)/adenine(1519)-N(6))-dimethyltransferase RsmA [Campylobacterales bacterium]|nr:16S rRNA (adenine(1518)-N(6)/adenine(1519)-N(6))-dimethyltransferase RsmA [Campylobacterales bacterium]
MVTAKKKFGQHFLKDAYYVKKIIQSIPNDNNAIVEIGPGLGDLTKELVNIKPVVAFEIDNEACEYLKDEYHDHLENKQLSLICGDVLDNWVGESLINKPYRLVANLPYNVGTKIMLKALKDPLCVGMIVMVQLEVAEKFSANCKEKNFSSLAVLTNSIGSSKIILEVPPIAFEPPPRVDSAVIKIDKNQPSYDDKLSEFLKGAFCAPRKTLIKNLSSKYDRKILEDLITSMDLSLTVRPHEVSTENYIKLLESLPI